MDQTWRWSRLEWFWSNWELGSLPWALEQWSAGKPWSIECTDIRRWRGTKKMMTSERIHPSRRCLYPQRLTRTWVVLPASTATRMLVMRPSVPSQEEQRHLRRLVTVLATVALIGLMRMMPRRLPWNKFLGFYTRSNSRKINVGFDASKVTIAMTNFLL